MKPMMIVGILFLVLGVVSLGYQGFTYTTKEKVVDLGPVQITADKEKTIPLPPVLGGSALVVGLVLLVMGSRQSK